VKAQVRTASLAWALIVIGASWPRVPLACGDQRPSQAVVVIVVARTLGVHVGVNRVRDGGVGAASLVLVDECGAFAVVPIRAIRSRRPAPLAAANVFPA
jgi:hypothetical protein